MSYSGKTPNYDGIKVGNEIEIVDDKVHYGDKDTDGSYRVWKNGADLVIQIRVSGVWENKDVINP